MNNNPILAGYVFFTESLKYLIDLSRVRDGILCSNMELKKMISINHKSVDVRMSRLNRNIRIEPRVIILGTLFLKDVVLEMKKATCILYDMEQEGMQLCTTEINVSELVEWANTSRNRDEILRNLGDVLSRFIILQVYDRHDYDNGLTAN